LVRITISLDQNEKDALFILADRECRDPRMQAALIIRRELERYGLVPSRLSGDDKVQGKQSGLGEEKPHAS
jgi:hypothetical protein